MRVILAFVVVAIAAVSSFQPSSHPQNTRMDTARYGLFDGFIKNMEAGYVGDDSAYQKAKASDEQKRAAKKAKFEAKRAQGFTELKDVKQRTFAKMKFGAEEEDDEPPAAPEKKKLFGLF